VAEKEVIGTVRELDLAGMEKDVTVGGVVSARGGGAVALEGG
jgi:hypothetical protein